MTMMRDIDAYLEHYGVKGQQWGVRKIRRPTPAQKNANAVKHLSDQELRARVDRMNLEANYARLTAPKKLAIAQIIQNVLKNETGRVAAVGATIAGALVISKGAAISKRILDTFK